LATSVKESLVILSPRLVISSRILSEVDDDSNPFFFNCEHYFCHIDHYTYLELKVKDVLPRAILYNK